MKSNTIQEILSHLKISFPGEGLMRKYANEKPPLRSELFSAEHMVQYGMTLAKEHRFIPGRAPNKLLKRLAENESVLVEVHNMLTEAVKANRRIIPAGEWLLDNFYLIQEQVNTGKKHLPKGYSEDLPRLTKGPSTGLPRVYDIAIEIISHSDGRVDFNSLSSFILAYQSVTSLKLGELWAIPIMLRLALIENLRRMATQIAITRVNQNYADYWAELMIDTAEKDPKSLILVIADMARSAPPLVSSFVAELTRRLQGKGTALAIPLSWLEDRLAENDQTSSDLIQSEIQKQAADQVSMSNSISSLRFLGTTNWRDFVETTSLVEQTLREDIDGVYGKMDFSTRDHYRHVVEKIAKNSELSEHEVANKVIQLAKDSAKENGPKDRKSHVGFYLVEKGVSQTEKLTQMQFSFSESIQKTIRRFPLLIYTGIITLFTWIIGGGMFARAYLDGTTNWLAIAVGILSLLAAGQLVITLINWVASLVVMPSLLPRMDFSSGIPEESRTMVIIPSMLTSNTEIESLAEALEVYFLANRDENLHFGLLTDFPDALQETLPEDNARVQLAIQKIEKLNIKYGSTDNSIFFLFHRPRKWNHYDKIWMGYERKRGKLTDLNDLLRGGARECFSDIIGNRELFPEIKYIITLDSDTRLPRDSAWKIIGSMAHPLNRAVYNEKKQRVTEGYGILQPRVELSLPGSRSSLYARMHGAGAGLDPYTRATSDAYQDIFDEGSFIGKGIYEVDTFANVLNACFPENRILSHDLLEGCYTRSGLLSDVQLYEKYPTRYLDDTKRRHRWIRGDWQIGAWALPFVTDRSRHLRRNPLSLLSRWKIFDNLRRSLIPAALTILLILGWTTLHNPFFWTTVVITIIILPFLVTSSRDIFHKPKEIPLRQHFDDSISSLANNLIQTLFTIICLPYEAYYTLDAILRTNWRMVVSKKRLLDWTPSSHSKRSQGKTMVSAYSTMWIAPFTGICMLIFLTIYFPINLIFALPILILWILSPGIAWWISAPLAKLEMALTNEQQIFLHKIARKTWTFFERFVGPEDNWLPPDNYQEHPVKRVAHRTSPTNMGLSLLANLTALDFGYITTGQFIERTTNSINTMNTLEQYRGHFFNWYDTVTLKALPPTYISTVDSGNLAGHLITLRQGILGIRHENIITPKLFAGLRDTLWVMKDELKDTGLIQSFEKELDLIEYPPLLTLQKAIHSLGNLSAAIEKIIPALQANSQNKALAWAEAISNQCNSAKEELLMLAPWLLISETPEKFKDIITTEVIPDLKAVAGMEKDLLPTITQKYSLENSSEEKEWLDALKDTLKKASHYARERIVSLEYLAAQCEEFADIEFDFLYDSPLHLLSIGYNVEERRRDPGFYDLLASEARLCTFVGIAQGKLPQDSWFALGRQLTNPGGVPILLSWSGSMFEYLMPLIVMPTYENTLLDQTYKASVQRQITYGKLHDVPWGISESGYNMVDASLNYQYRAFGIPRLGLKRGLGEDLVIAPYATIMALMVAPVESCENLELLKSNGFEGEFGFFEAIDYTPSRLPRGQSSVTIRSFMAHHQGMSFLSLSYLLLNQPMQKRFRSEPQFRATLLLLQERIPKATSYYSRALEVKDISIATNNTEMRVIRNPNTPLPAVQLLSNGRYHVMVTNSGGGYSRWKDLAITRWHEDSTCDNWGTFCYIRDTENDHFWSVAFQPTLKPEKSYEVVFSQGRAEFRRRDGNLETHAEIVVSPEDDIEMRRLNITNHSRRRKTIEITSYAEVVLSSAVADALHPAFSNLFVQTEILPEQHAILCKRRPRSTDEQTPCMFHLMTTHNAKIEAVSYETDRMRFIGRGNTIVNPEVMNHSGDLSGSEGSVLDPIVSIRYKITIEPEEMATINLVFGMGETQEACQGLVDKYQDLYLTDRVFELAWTHSQVVLRQINATETDAQLYTRLAGTIIYAHSSLRADPKILIQNHRGQSGLWSHSISGDLPIVLLQIEDPANINLVKQLVQAHAYLRLKGLVIDLVIWNEERGGYRQSLQNQIMNLITVGLGAEIADRPGGIFVRAADQISNEDRILIQTVARVNISDSHGTLEDQLKRRGITKTIVPLLTPSLPYVPHETPVLPLSGLQFFNGSGGFSPDGKEYIIATADKQVTPAPWVNILANPNFGTVISESGQSYTWVENAHEFRLTPWNNDPVSDTAGETFYLRDEETGHYWSPVPLPSRGKSPYLTKHGFGYTTFGHNENGIDSEVTVFVDIKASIKFIVLKIRNYSTGPRRLSVTGYVEWVLGDLRSKTSQYIITEMDPATGALFARNPYNTEFMDRVCFFAVNNANKTFTADRTEFIGRNGTLRNPDTMLRQHLSGKTGAALDPCGALQVSFDLAEGQEHEIIFLLGTEKNTEEAVTLLQQFNTPDAARNALEKVRNYWNTTLGTVQIKTPDQSVNLLANGWLIYQVLACRIWARSGFYQSGGAFGFRDQLQDVMAILHTQPDIAREHILLAASRQFVQGDVQHWWHPPSGRGVRTRCSDDYLWLPFVTSHYVVITGDFEILNKPVRFLEGRLLNPDEESYYDLAAISDQSSSLYDHCVRSVKNGLRFGVHGLPLMGSGDWNDGMDKVGQHGKGESVWLGFFLYEVLTQFIIIANKQNDTGFADECEKEAAQLKTNIQKNGWDGKWYRRAYFDDGTPLGSATNEECSIDSISQSWSVLSGGGESSRSKMGMDAADKHLVRREKRLIQLLDPPFDKSDLNPGYIKGYVPGVRENGGQYTHAAIWLTMAFAAMGDNQRAWELLSLINPVNHGNTPEAIATYKVEPYVMAADVYSEKQHTGHGGWTWYTGSAGWMYRLVVESLLGIRREGDQLRLEPCIPAGWNSFAIQYHYRETVYHIYVEQIIADNKGITLMVDGATQPDKIISLINDQKEHKVELKMQTKKTTETG
ncbi:MAG: glucoamylase family protein [Ginsengibacter sp.]